MVTRFSLPASTIASMPARFRTVGLGGTFDHFHHGHQHFISQANQHGLELVIGVTSDILTRQKPWSASMQPYAERHQAVKQFCRQNHIKADIFELTEPIGPTLEGTHIQALIVTPETEKGADAINTLRLRLRMRPLPAFVIPYWRNSEGEVLHSVAIRQGRLDTEGNNLWSVLDQEHMLSEAQRQFWSEPQGTIITQPNIRGTVTAVVGDVCLEHFRQRKWPYHLGIFDGKSQRADHTGLTELITSSAETTNQPGHISSALIAACRALVPQETALSQLRKNPSHLFVSGEEDLAAVVLAILLPLQSAIYYGQPNQGIVEMVVTPELKASFIAQLNPNLPRN